MALPVIRFFVPGPPTPKARHRSRIVRRKGSEGTNVHDWVAVEYPDRNTAREERRIWPYCHRAMHAAGIGPAPGPVALFVLAIFKVPLSLSRAEKLRRLWHVQRPDKDNCEKLIADALTGTAWMDDKQIVFGASFKVWSATQEGWDVWIVHLPEETEEGLAAFADLRSVAVAFLEHAADLTLDGRIEGPDGTLALGGLPW